MFEIIFDSHTIDTNCVFSHDNLKVNLAQSENGAYQFNKTRNTMVIKFDKVETNFGIGQKLMDCEMAFLKALTSHKKSENKECWVRSYEGVLSDFDLKSLESYNESKTKVMNSLGLTFNDNLKIDFNDKLIDVVEFQKLCKHQILTVNLNLMFYAIVNTTKDKLNISIRLKVKEIKILEMKNYLLHSFQINENEIVKNNRQYEFIKKYPTGQKKATNNILQLFTAN